MQILFYKFSILNENYLELGIPIRIIWSIDKYYKIRGLIIFDSLLMFHGKYISLANQWTTFYFIRK